MIRSSPRGRSETAISLPSVNGVTMPPDSRNNSSSNQIVSIDDRNPIVGQDEPNAPSSSSNSSPLPIEQAAAAGPSRANRVSYPYSINTNLPTVEVI